LGPTSKGREEKKTGGKERKGEGKAKGREGDRRWGRDLAHSKISVWRPLWFQV